METGVAVPSIVRLAELAEIFECGIEELLTDASNRKVDQARKIVEMLDGLPDDKRAMLMAVMRQLVDGFAGR